MIVLDTTVLLCAVGADDHFRDPCRALISAIADGRVQATTTTEVIQEFTHVRARRRGRPSAVRHAEDDADLLSRLLTITSDDLKAGLALFERVERLGAFDAVLAATATAAQAIALVSADGAFADVTGVAHVTPDAAGVAALLREPGGS